MENNYALARTRMQQVKRRLVQRLAMLLLVPMGAVAATSDASAAQVNLSWVDNSNNESGFKIERALVLGIYLQVATVGPNVTSYTDTGLLAGTSFNYRVRAYNSAGDSGHSNTALISIPLGGGNTAPTISDITNRTISEVGATAALAFTISDAETTATALTVTGSSSNTSVVPNSNIVFGGSGANRTVKVTPAANASGNSTITVQVSDGSLTATDTFVVTVSAVNDRPTITNIQNQALASGAATGALAFTVGDIETAAGSLTVTRSSSNTTLVPLANVVLGGSGANRTVNVTSAAGQTGTATITVTVSDGALSANDTFTITVTTGAASNPPAVGSISDQTGGTGGKIGPISFAVADFESAATSLVVSGSSSNQSLVPNANIVFGGSGATRTVTVIAAAGQSGTATITVTVSDGVNSNAETFVAAFGAAAPSESRLLNLSSRLLCRPSVDALIPGFVVSGTVNKRVLLRAVGPTLGGAPFNIPGMLPNPRMTLKRWNGSAFVEQASNDNWGSSSNVAEIRQVSNQLSAFPLVEGGLDAVLLVDLAPGQYTILADDVTNASGLVIVEIYDADATGTSSRLVNMSNRGHVGIGGEVMITGFVISPESAKTLLIRAVGPGVSGAPFNVPNTIEDPILDVYRRNPDGTDTLILTNDNWSDSTDATQTALVAAQVSAFPLPTGSLDAALVANLQPGIYSVVVRGVDNTTGTTLVEVYNVE